MFYHVMYRQSCLIEFYFKKIHFIFVVGSHGLGADAALPAERVYSAEILCAPGPMAEKLVVSSVGLLSRYWKRGHAKLDRAIWAGISPNGQKR